MIVYTTLDAEGRTVTLVPGFPFTTHVLNGAPCEINHPWGALDAYTADDLARFGITAATEPDPPAPAPQTVSMRQAKLALNNAGLLTAVNNAVASADVPTQIEWSCASTIDQTDPHFQAIVTVLGWSQAQVQQLFTAAAAL